MAIEQAERWARGQTPVPEVDPGSQVAAQVAVDAALAASKAAYQAARVAFKAAYGKGGDR